MTRQPPPGLIPEAPDPRNDDYLIVDHLEPTTPRKVVWKTGPVLNQGQTGACVGFAFACEAIAKPRGDLDATRGQGNALGWLIWRRAKKLSNSTGLHDDARGTTLSSGAKAAQDLGIIENYLWGETIDDVRQAVQAGPVVVASYWYFSLGNTDKYMNIRLNRGDDKPATSHAICIIGYDPAREFTTGRRKRKRTVRKPAYLIRNSWGKGWGFLDGVRIKRNGKKRWFFKRTGEGWIAEDDLAWLMEQYPGHAVILPVGRRRVDVPSILATSPDGF